MGTPISIEKNHLFDGQVNLVSAFGRVSYNSHNNIIICVKVIYLNSVVLTLVNRWSLRARTIIRTCTFRLAVRTVKMTFGRLAKHVEQYWAASDSKMSPPLLLLVTRCCVDKMRPPTQSRSALKSLILERLFQAKYNMYNNILLPCYYTRLPTESVNLFR